MSAQADRPPEQVKDECMEYMVGTAAWMIDVHSECGTFRYTALSRNLGGDASPLTLYEDIAIQIHALFITIRELAFDPAANNDNAHSSRVFASLIKDTMIDSLRRYYSAQRILDSARAQTTAESHSSDASGSITHADVLPDRFMLELDELTRAGGSHYARMRELQRVTSHLSLPTVERKYAPVWDHLIETIARPPRLGWRSRAMLGFLEAARVLGIETTSSSLSVSSALETLLSQIRDTQRVEEIAEACVRTLGHPSTRYRNNHLISGNKNRPKSDKKVWLVAMGNLSISRLAREGPSRIPP